MVKIYTEVFEWIRRDHRIAKLLNRSWIPVDQVKTVSYRRIIDLHRAEGVKSKNTFAAPQDREDEQELIPTDIIKWLDDRGQLFRSKDGNPVLAVADQTGACCVCHCEFGDTTYVHELSCCGVQLHSKCALDLLKPDFPVHGWWKLSYISCPSCNGDPFGLGSSNPDLRPTEPIDKPTIEPIIPSVE